VFLGAYSESTLATFGELGLNREPAAGELVQDGDLDIISTPTDFVGVNHYHSMKIEADANEPTGVRMHQATPNHQSNWGWPNTPDALFKILKRVAAEYTQLPIYITENGITLDDYVSPTGEVNDPDRIDYLNGYINAVGRAVEDGIDVSGYFAWSFMDNFEWAEGYSKRFGLVYVDFASQKRTPKSSAKWYSALIQDHKKKAGK
jgi:beta-glucosidase